jgi:hypothetical protein
LGTLREKLDHGPFEDVTLLLEALVGHSALDVDVGQVRLLADCGLTYRLTELVGFY